MTSKRCEKVGRKISGKFGSLEKVMTVEIFRV